MMIAALCCGDMDLDLDLTVVLTDRISGISHPYPTAEWITYSHGAVIDYARLAHRENAIGGELRHSGSPEAGRVAVTDAAGRLRIDYVWETLTVTAGGSAAVRASTTI
jgi:hypothetical protein